MGKFLKSLAFRIGASVVAIEVIVLVVIGVYAVGRLSQEMDRRTRDRITLPGVLMERGVLAYETVSDRAIISNLIGEELMEGMVVGANRNVFHALDPDQLGRDVRDIPGIDPAWFSSSLRTPHLIEVEDGPNTYLASITPLFVRGTEVPTLFAFLKVNTTALTAKKTELVNTVIFATLVCVVLTSAIIFLVFKITVLRRVKAAAGFVRKIGAGESEVPPLRVGSDELGILEDGINHMAEDLDQRARQRNRMEEDLRQSQERFRDFASSSSDWFWELDADLRYVTVSDRFFELVGGDGSPLGRPADQLGVEAAQEGGWPLFMESLRQRKVVQEFDITWTDQHGQQRFARLAGIPVFDRTGAFVGYRGTGRDITLFRQARATLERRVEERTAALKRTNEELQETLENLNRAQMELVRAEKLASLGALVAGVAHEINTPVGIAVTAASHLADRTHEMRDRLEANTLKRADLLTFLDVAGEAATLLLSNMERASSLIQSFKQVASDRASELLRSFALKPYLEDIVTSLSPTLRKTRHRIDVDCTDNLEISGYPGLLSQVVSNLVMNSLIHAYDEDAVGHMRISVRQPDSQTVEIVYSDDGCGIDPVVLPKIFDPFFTTRRGAGSTGLGLHIVHNIVTSTLKGQITALSEPGRGATFIVRLPRVLTETAEAAE